MTSAMPTNEINNKKGEGERREPRRVPTASAVLPDGALLEMTYDPSEKETAFVRWDGGRWSREAGVLIDPTHRLVPFSPQNNLVQNDVVLFPSTPEEYGTADDLVTAIRAFIQRYVTVSDRFL